MKTYKWKDGSRAPRGVSADAAGQEFERIRKQHGTLTSDVVVEEARPDDAVLHPAFEWNDSVAADKYRKHQASTLVRSIVVMHQDDDKPEHRAYALVTKADEPKKVEYVPAEVVAARVDLFADAVRRLQSKMREVEMSVRELETLAKNESADPERIARISMATKALETATAAIAGLH